MCNLLMVFGGTCTRAGIYIYVCLLSVMSCLGGGILGVYRSRVILGEWIALYP